MNSFDPERAIAEWKRALRRNPALEDGQATELGAGVGSLLRALITVGYQALRAARANPVEALKNE